MTTLKTTQSKVAIIITAAGSSTRIGTTKKKEYLQFNDGTVLSACVNAFLDCCIPFISNFIITIPQNDELNAKNAVLLDSKSKILIEQLKKERNLSIDFVQGDKTRQSSVFNALDFIQKSGIKPDVVLIHDGARPFVSRQIIENVLNSVFETGASVPGIIPIDTQKQVDEDGFITEHLVRNSLRSVQTPQGFFFEKLYKAHQKAKSDEKEYTDDTEIWGRYEGKVKIVEGDIKNIKITYPKDLKCLEENV